MRNDQLTILAVDDERPPLEDLARILRSSPCVREVECVHDGHDALVRASTQPFDAIFLDVRMPDLDGLELGRVLRRFATPPQLVFVSAYDSAAVGAFELHALDYLKKPVGRRRVEEAIERVMAAVASTAAFPPAGHGDGPRRPSDATADESEVIAVASMHGGSTRLLPRGTIHYVQSYGDFVRVVTADGRYLLRSTLAEIEHRWASGGFVRVHRQYVANLHRAVELTPLLGGSAELKFAGGQTIPVARRHTAELGRRLGI